MSTNSGFLRTGIPELFFLILLIAILTFEVAMFISVLRNKAIAENTRILWIIGMLLIHPFVAIVYYFTDYKQKT